MTARSRFSLSAICSALLFAFTVSPTLAITLNDDLATTKEDQPVVINVLSNDLPSSNSNLVNSSLRIVRQPENGRAEISGEHILYQGNHNYSGNDSIEYQVSDSSGAQASATASVQISQIQDRSILTSPRLIHGQVGQAIRYQVTTQGGEPDLFWLDLVQAKSDITQRTRSGSEYTTVINQVGHHKIEFSLNGDLSDSLVRFIAHGTAADPEISLQAPATLLTGQASNLVFTISQQNPFLDQSISVDATITLTGSFAVTSSPANCTATAQDKNTGFTFSCTQLPISSEQSAQIIIGITPSTTGFIASNAQVGGVSGEARSTNNYSQQQLPVVDQLVSATRNIQAIPASNILSFDVDSDGDQDLLITPNRHAQPQWKINDGNGSFSTGSSLFAAIHAIKALTGDLDNDQSDELILISRSGEVHIYRLQNNQFMLAQIISAWDRPAINYKRTFVRDAYLADINNDQYPELLVAANEEIPFFPNIAGVLQPASGFDQRIFACGDFACQRQFRNHALAIADFNGDSRADLFAPDSRHLSQLYLNNGQTASSHALSWHNPIAQTFPYELYQLATSGDFNNDQLGDAVVHQADPRTDENFDRDFDFVQRYHELDIFNGHATAISRTPSQTIQVPELDALTAMDIDLNGRDDLFLLTQQGSGIILQNQQDGFNLFRLAVNAGEDAKVTIADLNNDNQMDLAIVSPHNNQLSLYLTNGESLNFQRSSAGGGSGYLSFYWLVLIVVVLGLFALVKKPAIKAHLK